MLELRADVLLLPQTLTEAPVRRGEEDFVWMWNTETGRPRYNRKYASLTFWKCSLTPAVWHEPWQPPPARTAPPHSLSYLHFYYNKRNVRLCFNWVEYRQLKKETNAVWHSSSKEPTFVSWAQTSQCCRCPSVWEQWSEGPPITTAWWKGYGSV